MISMDKEMDYEREIDLRELSYYILKHWRILVIIPLISGVLLGGVKICRQLRSLQSKSLEQQTIIDSEQLEQNYENEKLSLQLEIDALQKALDNAENYSHDSLLMNLDPYKVYESSADIYIKTDYTILPDKVYQNPDYTDSIVSSYQLLLLKSSILDKLSSELGMESIYLKELIKVSAEVNTRMIHIKVIHADKSISENILNTLIVHLQNKKPDLESLIGSHTINILTQDTEEMIRTDIADMQQKQHSSVKNMQNSLQEKKDALEHLEKPVSHEITIKYSAIKYMVMGGILGLCIACFILCVRFINSDKLLSVEELKKMYNFNIFELPYNAFFTPPPLLQ